MILPQRRSSSSPRTTSSTRTEGARALLDIPLVRLARDIARLEPRTAWRTAGTRTGRRPSPMRRSASRSPPRSSKVGAARARSNNVPGGARHSRTTPPTAGYYRLATAQVELHQYDVAANTIKQGFEHDSGAAANQELNKLMRIVKVRALRARETVGRRLTERANRRRRHPRPRPHGGPHRVFPRVRWTRARARR